MNQQYKPGDVAMVTALNRTTPYRAYYDGETWREYGLRVFCVDQPATIRPLIVIDPEDEDAAKALGAAYWRIDPESVTDGTITDMQEALRSLLPRPEPEEPTGLGAVVRDGYGVRWSLTTTFGDTDTPRWTPENGTDCDVWSNIPRPLTVLSEGIQP